MAISELRVFAAEELSSSAEHLLGQSPQQSWISPYTLLEWDPKHMNNSQGAGEL